MTDKILYEETQRFRQPWIWVLLVCSMLIPLLSIGMQLVVERDAELAGVFAGVLVLGLLPLALFAYMKLVVRVEGGSLSIRFVPFLRKHYPLQDVSRWEVCDFRPLSDYGGWGIRRGRGGWAYTVSGNRGVQLEFRDGRKLLVGSQHPEKLIAALEQARSRG
ncbi:hypothetical protein [Archangium sp.]|jgi:hypothetical protein|uniref:hypothetical protein n=1 Tax=Archangium sp. TaxID=1872627 RepID=UPI002ED8619F